MVSRIIILSLLWLTVTSGSWQSWILGIPAVFVAAFTSKNLASNFSYTFSIIALVKFIAFFLIESFKGGFDVALRVLKPTLNIQPNYIPYQTTLPGGLPRTLLSSSISLLPGTLTADTNGDKILIHSLTDSKKIKDEIAVCEQYILEIFPNTKYNVKETF